MRLTYGTRDISWPTPKTFILTKYFNTVLIMASPPCYGKLIFMAPKRRKKLLQCILTLLFQITMNMKMRRTSLFWPILLIENVKLMWFHYH